MQAIASWLVARPQNAILGLVVTLSIPALAPQLTSGVILVLLVLARGARLAVIEGLVAVAILATTTLILGDSPVSLLGLVAAAWAPLLLLAVMLVATRSLTLTMQVSVILAIVAMLTFEIVVADTDTFWAPYIAAMTEVVRQNGIEWNTDALSGDIMTRSVFLTFWLLNVAGLLFGYALYRRLPSETNAYGWFRDLNFGRVIAFTFVLALLLTLINDAGWLYNVSFTMFVMFMLQGLAIVHWLHAEKILPLGALVALYVALPILHILLMVALAIVGYTDVWFTYRRRFKKA